LKDIGINFDMKLIYEKHLNRVDGLSVEVS